MTSRKNSIHSGCWFLYLLKCRDGTLYTGITNNLERRIEQHNEGKASRYTRSRLPVKLVYQECCLNKSIALKQECRIKSLSREEKEAYLRIRRQSQGRVTASRQF